MFHPQRLGSRAAGMVELRRRSPEITGGLQRSTTPVARIEKLKTEHLGAPRTAKWSNRSSDPADAASVNKKNNNHILLFFIFALLFSLPPSHNSDPGSHSRLFSPLPTTVRALHFIARGL